MSPHPNRVTFSIADTGNFKIRRVHFGDIGPTVGAFGDSGLATNAWITQPRAVTTDSTGLLWVVAVSKGKAPVTFAGGTCGFSGDGGPASAAQLCSPGGMAADGFGNIYIADTGNNRIRKITLGPDGIFNGADDIISTVTPTGVAPLDVAVGAGGSLYIALADHTVAKWTGVLTTIAGTGAAGFSGDGPGTGAQLSGALSVAYDSFTGRVYIADTGNNRVRYLEP